MGKHCEHEEIIFKNENKTGYMATQAASEFSGAVIK